MAKILMIVPEQHCSLSVQGRSLHAQDLLSVRFAATVLCRDSQGQTEAIMLFLQKTVIKWSLLEC